MKHVCLSISIDDESWLWHARMGHTNFRMLEEMARKEMVTGMPRLTHPSQVCEGCMITKKPRQSFPKMAQWRAKEPLQLLHLNLCGPITPETKGGNQYFLLIMDDYS